MVMPVTPPIPLLHSSSTVPHLNHVHVALSPQEPFDLQVYSMMMASYIRWCTTPEIHSSRNKQSHLQQGARCYHCNFHRVETLLGWGTTSGSGNK